MKKIQKFFLYGLIGLLLTGCGGKTQPQPTGNLKIAQEAFADGKLRELAWLTLAQTGGTGNVCISPEGIAEALMIPQNAADAEKSQWIGDILGQNRVSQSRANEILRDLRRLQTSPGKGKWLAHWELFVGENRPVKESFLELCRKELELSSTFVQLQGDGANTYFARWVDDSTKGGIKNVSWRPENPLSLTLSGVEYIAPLWENTIDSAKTLPSPFTSAEGNQAAVPMMGVLEKCGVYEGEDGIGAFLPMAGDEVRLILLIPPEGMSLAEFLPTAAKKQMDWQQQARWEDQRVVMPPIKSSYDGSLGDMIRTLGAGFVFDAGGLPGMGEGAALSDILFRMEVNIDESGTQPPLEGIKYYRPGVNDGIKTIIANRPFLFALELQKTGQILAAGYVTDPLADKKGK